MRRFAALAARVEVPDDCLEERERVLNPLSVVARPRKLFHDGVWRLRPFLGRRDEQCGGAVEWGVKREAAHKARVSKHGTLRDILDGSVEYHFHLDVGAPLAEDERRQRVLEQLAQRLPHGLRAREKRGRAAVRRIRKPFVLRGGRGEGGVAKKRIGGTRQARLSSRRGRRGS